MPPGYSRVVNAYPSLSELLAVRGSDAAGSRPNKKLKMKGQVVNRGESKRGSARCPGESHVRAWRGVRRKTDAEQVSVWCIGRHLSANTLLEAVGGTVERLAHDVVGSQHLASLIHRPAVLFHEHRRLVIEPGRERVRLSHLSPMVRRCVERPTVCVVPLQDAPERRMHLATLHRNDHVAGSAPATGVPLKNPLRTNLPALSAENRRRKTGRAQV